MEHINKEEPRKTHEQHFTDVYDMLITARTALKIKIKLRAKVPVNYKVNFYAAFIQLYGLAYPKLTINEHKDLIGRINDWDARVKIGVADDGIEEGIKLSEELQKALMIEGKMS